MLSSVYPQKKHKKTICIVKYKGMGMQLSFPVNESSLSKKILPQNQRCIRQPKKRISEEKENEKYPYTATSCKKIRLCNLYSDYLGRNSFMAAFFKLFDDDVIQDFLWMDSCAKISDRFLLAMVYTYFKRAGFTKKEYTRMNFFLALYLANDMEEDEEEFKYDIFPWALGRKWRELYPSFLLKRDRLWKSIAYRAVVSHRTCEEVMAIVPDHHVWQRFRREHHGGAFRDYERFYDGDGDVSPKGPGSKPTYCKLCEECKENEKCSISTSDYSDSTDSSDSSQDSNSSTEVPPQYKGTNRLWKKPEE